MTDEIVDATSERAESISWLELFFDLVVVAAVGVFTDGVRADLTWGGVGLTALLYAVVWTSWSLTVLYANVAGVQTRLRTMSITMFLIAVMAAAAPIHDADRANVFAIAFVLVRLIVARGSLRTGRVLVSWPLLQFGGLLLPWIVSLWIDTPAKYWLWAAALALDMALVTLRGGEEQGATVARMQQRLEREARGRRPVPAVVSVEVDRAHLDERLGLFVIILLGEAVILLVHDASEHAWTLAFGWAGVGCFVLLLGLWRMAFDHGFTGAPHTSLADLPPRFGLPLHLVATTGLLFIAAALADLLLATGQQVEEPVGWLLAAGLALHFGVGLVAGVAGHAPWRWLVWWAGLCTVFSIALGFVGPLLHAGAFVWVAALPAIWQAYAGRLAGAPPAQPQPV